MDPERLGPYRILRRLGRGGMGVVYEALEETSGRRVAVKLVGATSEVDDGLRSRFEAEIHSLRRLNHPNIVKLLGFGEQSGRLYYAMELVEGNSLEAELARGRRFDWREVVQMAMQVCQALRHAHDRGIIHRDIKPSNLLLAPPGTVKLSDFGIARIFGQSRLTMPGNVVGTAEFMAPEQAEGKPVEPAADLYSLGAVMYVLLSGRPLFRAGSLPEMLHKQRFEQPQPLETLVRDLPEQLHRLVAELLAKDPARRPGQAVLVQRRLAAIERAYSVPSAEDSLAARDASDPAHSPLEPPEAASADSRAEPSQSEPERAQAAGHESAAPQGEGIASLADQGPSPTEPTPQESPQDRLPAMSAEDGKEDDALVAETRVTSAFRPGASPRPGRSTEAAASATCAGTTEGRFVRISEDQLDQPEHPRKPHPLRSPQTWMLILAIAGLLASAWYLLKPPSADELYERITARMDGTESDLRGAEADIQSFLARFPDDPRADQLRERAFEIRLIRLDRSFQRRVEQPDIEQETQQMLPAERAYLKALRIARRDPARAADELQSLVDLYGLLPEQRKPGASAAAAGAASPASKAERQAMCVELARRRLSVLRRHLAEQHRQDLAAVLARLDQADRLKAAQPDRARAIYRAVIELYEGDGWAAEAVQRARRALNQSGAAAAAGAVPTDRAEREDQ